MEDYIGSITMFAFNWAPRGYATCQGELFAISQNAALFSLLGTTFGGDGQSTFALPDLRARVPVGQGNSPQFGTRMVGQIFGSDTVTLTPQNLTPHTHTIGEHQANQTAVLHAVSALGDKPEPTGHNLAGAVDSTGKGAKIYSDTAPDVTMASSAVTINAGNLVANSTGSGHPFSVDQPSLVVGYAICTQGLFPSRN